MNPNVDIQSRFVNALRGQVSSRVESSSVDTLPCPYYGHVGRIFQTIDQLLVHVKTEHSIETEGLNDVETRAKLRDAVSNLRNQDQLHANEKGTTIPDITGLSLESSKRRQTSPSSGKKRRAHPDVSRNLPYTHPSGKPQARPQDCHLYNFKQEPRSIDAKKDERSSPGRTPSRQQQSNKPSAAPPRQPGLIELQKYDPRYPDLLLQPDSRPISQEQLASEVKSIYAGLTMVETKCIHVDRAQAAATKIDANGILAPDHWQALIALHRTLLHEHHDFFLASQHPSASPALRRLAAKYSMPARLWKHGIYAFLELLRRRLPHSLDCMLAFIYLAYQMMALLYETVPVFEDTLGTPKFSYRCAKNQASPSFPYSLLGSLYTKLSKLIARARKAIGQNGCRDIGAMLFLANLQLVSASEPTTLSNPTPLLRDVAVFDYVLYGLMLPSMALLWYVGEETTGPSFVAMLLFACFWLAAVDTSSLLEIRTTIVQIWVVFAFNYVARDCVHAIQPKLHALKYIVLSTVFLTLGRAMLPSDDADKTLKVLPLSVALAAVVLSFISNNIRPGRLPDIEEGAILRRERDGPFVSPHISATEDDRHATTGRNQIPDPAHFDLGSLRSDSDSASIRG